jgi:hypothetical protein
MEPIGLRRQEYALSRDHHIIPIYQQGYKKVTEQPLVEWQDFSGKRLKR